MISLVNFLDEKHWTVLANPDPSLCLDDNLHKSSSMQCYFLDKKYHVDSQFCTKIGHEFRDKEVNDERAADHRYEGTGLGGLRQILGDLPVYIQPVNNQWHVHHLDYEYMASLLTIKMSVYLSTNYDYDYDLWLTTQEWDGLPWAKMSSMWSCESNRANIYCSKLLYPDNSLFI